MNRYCLLVTVAIMLVGCSGPDQDEVVNPVEETVFDDQVQTMDRARAVEDQLKDSADARRRELKGRSASQPSQLCVSSALTSHRRAAISASSVCPPTLIGLQS